MADPAAERSRAEQPSEVFAALSPADDVVDFGVGSLDLSHSAAEIEDFVAPASPTRIRSAVPSKVAIRTASTAPVEPIFESPQRSEPTISAGSIGTARQTDATDSRLGFLNLVWVGARWFLGGVLWLVQCLFGIVAMVLALAVVASIPVLNLLALGYLLEVEGRVGRSGRLRDAFPLVPTVAPRLGAIVLGSWLCLLPLRFLANAAADARIIEAGSFADRAFQVILPLAAVVLIVHLSLAIANGGSLISFLCPPLYLVKLFRRVRQGNFWSQAESAVSEFLRAFRFQHHFWLGLRGYFGAFLWLVIPTALFASTRRTEGLPVLVMLFGGFLLIIVLSWVPFLQAHYAAENRFQAMFELGTVRQLFRKSPLMWLLSITLTLAIALPLYLAKVVIPPADGAWLVTPFFIVTIYPMKVLTGWAYHRAASRPKHAFFLWRWLCWLLMIPVLATFVFILFFTQFIGEHGKQVLFEHHAFLLPSPF